MDTSVDHVLTLASAPDALLTLEDVKQHCRVDGTADDVYLTSLIATATAALDGPNGMLGKAIVTQSWSLRRERLLGKERLQIPLLPFQSVTSLKYYDADNAQQTATLSDYIIFGNQERGYIEPVTAWPAMYDRPDAVEMVFVSGYGTKASVPSTIKHACKMLVAHWYEAREAVVMGATPLEVPFTVEALVNLERAGWVKS
jgi:uncharacterized phiE125 gp8 family phage protein